MSVSSDRETAIVRARGYDLRVVALGIAYQAEVLDGVKYSESADTSSITINPQLEGSKSDLGQDRSIKCVALEESCMK